MGKKMVSLWCLHKSTNENQLSIVEMKNEFKFEVN